VRVGASFSSALREADELGLTEPDPREGLGGRDVARKLVILGRMAGFSIEMADVDVRPLLPDEPWVSGSLADFWDRLSERWTKDSSNADKLTYLASVEDGQATVQMVALPSTHPCGGLSASENQVAVTSRRYSETRLVIQGPGAGPEVTAAGVFADVLRALVESSWTDRI